MSKQGLQTMQVLPVHDSLKMTIENFLSCYMVQQETLTNDGTAVDESSSDAVVQEANLFDFGVRFKLIAIRRDTDQQNSKDTVGIELGVSIPEWSTCKEDATRRLRAIYHDAFEMKVKNKNTVALSTNVTAADDYDFWIKVDLAVKYFDSTEKCAESLSQIRIQCIGGPVFHAMERIIQEQSQDSGNELMNSIIPSLPRCGECRCIGSDEKVMIIFSVRLAEEMERALARVFLQQFVGAQKQVSQTPHCEFRRGNDPPKELLPLSGGDILTEGDQPNLVALPPLVGYLSFTYFPSHLRTPERLQKAVQQMVNFLPYLDKHLKSTKSFMHSRMRAKKDDLLRELKKTVGTTESTTTKFGSLITKKNKKTESQHQQTKGRKIMSPNPRLAAI